MQGGIVQLIANNIEDNIFINEPQITFFKTAYKRHSNFALDQQLLLFTGSTNFNDKQNICIIKKLGDLLGRLYIRFELPEIIVRYRKTFLDRLIDELCTYDIDISHNNCELLTLIPYENTHLLKYINHAKSQIIEMGDICGIVNDLRIKLIDNSPHYEHNNEYISFIKYYLDSRSANNNAMDNINLLYDKLNNICWMIPTIEWQIHKTIYNEYAKLYQNEKILSELNNISYLYKNTKHTIVDILLNNYDVHANYIYNILRTKLQNIKQTNHDMPFLSASRLFECIYKKLHPYICRKTAIETQFPEININLAKMRLCHSIFNDIYRIEYGDTFIDFFDKHDNKLVLTIQNNVCIDDCGISDTQLITYIKNFIYNPIPYISCENTYKSNINFIYILLHDDYKSYYNSDDYCTLDAYLAIKYSSNLDIDDVNDNNKMIYYDIMTATLECNIQLYINLFNVRHLESVSINSNYENCTMISELGDVLLCGKRDNILSRYFTFVYNDFINRIQTFYNQIINGYQICNNIFYINTIYIEFNDAIKNEIVKNIHNNLIKTDDNENYYYFLEKINARFIAIFDELHRTIDEFLQEIIGTDLQNILRNNKPQKTNIIFTYYIKKQINTKKIIKLYKNKICCLQQSDISLPFDPQVYNNYRPEFGAPIEQYYDDILDICKNVIIGYDICNKNNIYINTKTSEQIMKYLVENIFIADDTINCGSVYRNAQCSNFNLLFNIENMFQAQFRWLYEILLDEQFIKKYVGSEMYEAIVHLKTYPYNICLSKINNMMECYKNNIKIYNQYKDLLLYFANNVSNYSHHDKIEMKQLLNNLDCELKSMICQIFDDELCHSITAVDYYRKYSNIKHFADIFCDFDLKLLEKTSNCESDLIKLLLTHLLEKYNLNKCTSAQLVDNIKNNIVINKKKIESLKALLVRNYEMIRFEPEKKHAANFAWVHRLGHFIIDQVEIEIGNQIIDRHYGSWLNIWYELTHLVGHERGYNKMIGNVPELCEYNNRIKPAYIMHVPLLFWFCKENGVALPLVALQYAEVKLYLKLRPFEQVAYYDKDTEFVTEPKLHYKLLAEYICVGETERLKIARSRHEYLIEQLQTTNEITINCANADICHDLYFKNPCKELIWTVQDNSMIDGTLPNGQRCWDTYLPVGCSEIRLCGNPRVPLLEHVYYNSVQPYQAHSHSPCCGINVYSFALFPENYQQSGSINLSRIEIATLIMQYCQNSSKQGSRQQQGSRQCLLQVYTTSYNVLKIMSGMCGVTFT